MVVKSMMLSPSVAGARVTKQLMLKMMLRLTLCSFVPCDRLIFYSKRNPTGPEIFWTLQWNTFNAERKNVARCYHFILFLSITGVRQPDTCENKNNLMNDDLLGNKISENSGREIGSNSVKDKWITSVSFCMDYMTWLLFFSGYSYMIAASKTVLGQLCVYCP